MKQILDIHIHSKYSRACSPKLTISNIEEACRTKGVDIISTGDFTFPKWFSDIKEYLEESSGKGLYRLKSAKDDKVKFMLTTELALVYKKAGLDGVLKCRRLHLVVCAPDIKSAEKLNNYLDKRFNIRSDGRPILGLSAEDLMKICFGINPKFLIFPAHIWTPWFAVFGSKSGFDSLEECFGKYTDKIYAYETGLSSDPEMNWRLSALDKLTCLSNSDAHSLANLAREATVMSLDKPSYDEIYNVIKNKDLKKLKYTIEFYPEEGMYHFDGHRACGVSFTPNETKKKKGLCPKCGKPLIIGVMNRVDELADRKEGFKPRNAVEFKKLVELDKIIAEIVGVKSRNSKKVQKVYENIVKEFKTELNILIDEPIENLKKFNETLAEGIKRVRAGDLIISPGFDGQYGEVKIFKEGELDKQKTLF